MPLAAVRAPDLAFLISVSGAAVPAAETQSIMLGMTWQLAACLSKWSSSSLGS